MTQDLHTLLQQLDVRAAQLKKENPKAYLELVKNLSDDIQSLSEELEQLARGS